LSHREDVHPTLAKVPKIAVARCPHENINIVCMSPAEPVEGIPMIMYTENRRCHPQKKKYKSGGWSRDIFLILKRAKSCLQ
jgi:hypothetical protein